MKNKSTLLFLISLLMFDVTWCLQGISMAAERKNDGRSIGAPPNCAPYIKNATFSPAGDKIVFQHGCIGKEDTFLWTVYEISSKKIYDYKELNNATPYQLKYDLAFSHDGKQVAFVSGQDNHRNIYVMDTDGTNVRQLTHDDNKNPQDLVENPAATNLTAINIKALKDKGYWEIDKYIAMKYNEKPSFSPDGKRLIFVCSAALFRYSYNKQPSLWDVYEVEIESGKKRKLTEYAFHYTSAPFYLSDGKRFVFSSLLDWESGISHEYHNYYNRKYGQNTIFIMDGINNELRPAFENGKQSDEPRIGGDDIIIFQSELNYRDKTLWSGRTVDLASSIDHATFIYKSGKIKRLFDKSTLYAKLFQDGSHIYLTRSMARSSVEVFNMDGTGSTVIKIPLEQLGIRYISVLYIRS